MLIKKPISKVSNIDEFAPHLSKSNGDYPDHIFGRMYELEKNNFWFTNRNKIIQKIIKRIASKNYNLFEVGCGTGFVLEGLSKIDGLKPTGGDVYSAALQFAKSRVPEATFVQLDITDLPYENEFDIACAFDVLEHIEDDASAIANIYKCLKKDGHFVLTVPQHKFMWSITDDLALHKRRYAKEEMLSKLKKAGFKIKFTSSYIFAAFPFMILQRYALKNKTDNNKDVVHELEINPFLNHILNLLTKIDVFLLDRQVSIPVGGSLIVYAQK